MVSIIKNMIPSRNIIEATFPIGFVLGFVLILSSIASASKMASKHLKPIHMLTEQVKDMSANNLSTRLNLSGTKDELKDLAYTFNKMLDDIQKSYEREKQFVSDASHELRTPIAVIKGYAGMLNRWGKDDPEILEESIQAIMGESENMQSLVESLLFIARNDKGSLKMDLAEFDISDLLKEIVKETRMIDTHHQITDTIDDGLKVYGSADKLKQAFRIFIDNSIKYTLENGKIDIRLKSSEKHVILVIEDNGIGISDEDLPHIFDRFYRADKSRTKMKENQHGGTGLGLSIAKIIVEQHKGRIQVESALNQGTKFTLVIPKFVPESPELKESL
jgi:signal transduction histidine kinase